MRLLQSQQYWKWLASVLGIMGGIMISANIIDITKYSFIPFSISSVIWLFVSYKMKENSMIALNATFVLINMSGMYRWLL